MPTPRPLSQINVTDPFWAEWQRKLVLVTLDQQLEQLEVTGRLSNFERVAKGEKGGFEGYRFNDSDVYKWLEAASYGLLIFPKHKGSPRWPAALDRIIKSLEDAQMEDGYLNTYFQLGNIEQRWKNLNAMHEMYCGGHLIEAGVAHFECTGKESLLNVAIKWAEHLRSQFGPEARPGTDGHPEVELALLRLSKLMATRGRAKDAEMYKQDALWHLSQRGARPSVYQAELEDAEVYGMAKAAGDLLLENGRYSGEYAQDHLKIEHQTQVVGHAVRAMYLYTAATEVFDEMPEGTETAIGLIWDNLTKRRMYVTGGVGPAGRNEGFTNDFDLPNLDAYAETCASIGLVRFAQKLVERYSDASYVDILERALYNGSLSGISLSGDLYSYTNPLENRGAHHRVPWYGCACCPPNIARTIGEAGRFAVLVDANDIYINLPIGLETDSISIVSNYPHSGDFEVAIKKAGHYRVSVRIPDWCDDCEFEVLGSEDEAEFDRGYAVIERNWKRGDQIRVNLEMTPKWIEAHPMVLDNVGKIALQCGPVVYAFEHEESLPQRFRVDLNEDPIWKSGSSVIEVKGYVRSEDFGDVLYDELADSGEKDFTAKFIPFANCHNAGGKFVAVWIRI
ncbi:MAG: beta-L-arabinofuranosidase domain-containing protein [Fimbriimonadaceae bacterium]